MPEYLSPGVYVEEVPSGNKPIQGVGTSTGAFVGLAGDGPIGQAMLIGNRAEFFEKFGGFIAGAYLAHAVNLFFLNGGTRCYVVRINADGVTGLVDSDFTGDDGLLAFDPIDDVNIVAVPDSSAREVNLAGLAYCERRGDCFFLAHAPEVIDTAAAALAYKQATGALYPGQNAFNSGYGALYVPWLEVSDPLTGKALPVPPVGAVAGRYSATDVRRGVHKAPAGIEDGRLRSVLRLTRQLSRAEIEVLNPQNVNVLRRADGVGNVIWGARTLSADPEFRYVPTRRLLLFIGESIEEGTQWVVFEPNTPDLWKSIERNVKAFLRVVWRGGALFGATEEQAFYVKCDAETNPPDSIEEGKVVTEIGVAIVKPAEFVIFRISQSGAGAEISE